MSFRFRLSTLLRLRENLRDECRQQLAAAQRAHQIILDRIAQLEAEFADLRLRIGDFCAPGPLNVDRLLDAGRYELALKGQRSAADEQRQTVEAEVERRRQALVEADRAVKTLEKLREREATRHRQDEQRRESKLLDATALQTAYAREVD
jgi:flagellar protein FliJ